MDAIGPPQPPFDAPAPSDAGARSLQQASLNPAPPLDSCDPTPRWLPLDETRRAALPLAARWISGGYAWQVDDCRSGTRASATHLRYAFATAAAERLSPSGRASALRLLDNVAAASNLTFAEAGLPTPRPQLIFARGSAVLLPERGRAVATVAAPAAYDSPEQEVALFETLQAGLQRALGFVSPSASLAADTASVGNFSRTTRSSVLADQSSCLVLAGLGAVDLTGLTHLYGAAQQTLGDDTYTLNGNSPFTALIDTAGNNTLRAAYAGQVLLSLRDDGSLGSRVGEDHVHLAPTSQVDNGDMRASRGGFLVGNAAANRLWGSDFADFIFAGGGNDTLTGGAGADRFVLPDGVYTARVTDFAPREDQLHWTFSAQRYPPVQEEKTEADGRRQTLLRFAGGPMAILQHPGAGASFAAKRDVVYKSQLTLPASCGPFVGLFERPPPDLYQSTSPSLIAFPLIGSTLLLMLCCFGWAFGRARWRAR